MIHCAKNRQLCCAPENDSRSKMLKHSGLSYEPLTDVSLIFKSLFYSWAGSPWFFFLLTFWDYWIWNTTMSTGESQFLKCPHTHACKHECVSLVKILRMSTVCVSRNPGQLCFLICTYHLLNRHCIWALLIQKTWIEFCCKVNVLLSMSHQPGMISSLGSQNLRNMIQIQEIGIFLWNTTMIKNPSL